MGTLQTDLSEFIGLLNSHRVDYLIVGGHAVAYHGHPRFTGDIDFFLRPTLANAQRTIAALRDFGFGNLNIAPEDLLVPAKVIQLGRPPNRIDLLTSISGVGFDIAWASKAAAELDGHPVHFIGRDALIRNKRASGRDQDKADLRKLIGTRPQ